MSNEEIRVGFQGMRHSYSEIASKKLLEQYGITQYSLMPLVSSQEVSRSLRDKSVDFGVVAIQNTIGGVVKETDDAFFSNEWIVKHRYILKIVHCLFVKDESVKIKDVKCVASHIQALKQCKKTLTLMLGEYEQEEMDDTALAAVKLSKGTLNSNTAIICSKEAGLSLGLKLVTEGVQDQENNSTEFLLIEQDKQVRSKLEFVYAGFRKLWFDEKLYEYTKKILVSAIVLSTFKIQYLYNMILPNGFIMSNSQALIFTGGLSVALISFLNSYRKKHSHTMVAGYWIYIDKVSSENMDDNQNYATPRAVIIDSVENKLRIRGWICHANPERYFEAKEILHTDLFKEKGSLIYKYSNFVNGKDWNFNGIVELEWNNNEKQKSIKNLFGRYCGFLTNTTGSLSLKRVSKEMFYDICPIERSL